MVRIVRRPDGTVGVDVTGRAAGRGAYLHASEACVETARKRRALDRALAASVPGDVYREVWPGTGG